MAELTMQIPEFSGRKGERDAGRWWRNLEAAVRGTDAAIPLNYRTLVQIFDMKLTGEASVWADQTPEVFSVVDAAAPTEQQVNLLREVFVEKFGTVRPEPLKATDELRTLCQGPGEKAITYYRRANRLLCRMIPGKNFELEATMALLTEPEKIIMSQVVDKFCDGLYNQWMHFQVWKEKPGSLHQAYKLAEKQEEYQTFIQTRYDTSRDPALAFDPTFSPQAFYPVAPSIAYGYSNGVGSIGGVSPQSPNPSQVPIQIPLLHIPQQPQQPLATSPPLQQHQPPQVAVQPQQQQQPLQQQSLQQPQQYSSSQQQPPHQQYQPRGSGYNNGGSNGDAGRGGPYRGGYSNNGRGGNHNSSYNNNTSQDKAKEGARPQVSTNQYVNGSLKYVASKDGPLCVECGVLGHLPANCRNGKLENWEREALRNVVFERAYVNTKTSRLFNAGLPMSDGDYSSEITQLYDSRFTSDGKYRVKEEEEGSVRIGSRAAKLIIGDTRNKRNVVEVVTRVGRMGMNEVKEEEFNIAAGKGMGVINAYANGMDIDQREMPPQTVPRKRVAIEEIVDSEVGGQPAYQKTVIKDGVGLHPAAGVGLVDELGNPRRRKKGGPKVERKIQGMIGKERRWSLAKYLWDLTVTIPLPEYLQDNSRARSELKKFTSLEGTRKKKGKTPLRAEAPSTNYNIPPGAVYIPPVNANIPPPNTYFPSVDPNVP